MSINQRLKEYTESKNIFAPDLYKKIGATRVVWSDWINAGKAISVVKLQAILENLPLLNARWLLTGEGSMEEGGPIEVNIQEPKSEYKNYCKACEAKDAHIKSLQQFIDFIQEAKGKKGSANCG